MHPPPRNVEPLFANVCPGSPKFKVIMKHVSVVNWSLQKKKEINSSSR